VLVVRDYKYAPAGDEDAYRLQLEIYALAVAAAFPGRAVQAEIEWLRAPARRAVAAIDLEAARARLGVTGATLGAAMGVRRAAAFPMAYDRPAPCRALGCVFLARCFPGRHRAFRADVASGTMPV